MKEKGYRSAAEMVLSEFPDAQRNKQGDYTKALARTLIGDELAMLFRRQRELGNPHATSELEAAVLGSGDKKSGLFWVQKPALAGSDLLKMLEAVSKMGCKSLVGMAGLHPVCVVRGVTHGATGRVDGCTVEVDRAVVSQAAEAAPQRQAADRAEADHEWRAVDSAHRRPLAGSARSIPAVPDLPPTVPALGQDRRVGEGAQGPGATVAGRGRFRSGRVLYRRQLRRGQKGGAAVGKTKRGKGTKLMAVANRAGAPVAVHIDSASPHEVKLVEATIEARMTANKPGRLIGDLAYDSDPLDQRLAERGIHLIAPHRDNRVRPATQDGRELRRYKRRWKVERLFAWLHNFRRLVIRYEYYPENFLGFVHLGCMLILMRMYF
jgi:transposase